MTRLESASDEIFYTEVHTLQEDIRTIKRAQRLGTKNIAIYYNTTMNGYDKQFSLGSNARISFTVAFAANVQHFAQTTLSYAMFLNSPTAEFHPQIDNASNDPKAIIVYVNPAYSVSADPLVTTWRITVLKLTTGTATYYMKFHVESTDRGGITVS